MKKKQKTKKKSKTFQEPQSIDWKTSNSKGGKLKKEKKKSLTRKLTKKQKMKHYREA